MYVNWERGTHTDPSTQINDHLKVTYLKRTAVPYAIIYLLFLDKITSILFVLIMDFHSQ